MGFTFLDLVVALLMQYGVPAVVLISIAGLYWQISHKKRAGWIGVYVVTLLIVAWQINSFRVTGNSWEELLQSHSSTDLVALPEPIISLYVTCEFEDYPGKNYLSPSYCVGNAYRWLESFAVIMARQGGYLELAGEPTIRWNLLVGSNLCFDESRNIKHFSDGNRFIRGVCIDVEEITEISAEYRLEMKKQVNPASPEQYFTQLTLTHSLTGQVVDHIILADYHAPTTIRNRLRMFSHWKAPASIGFEDYQASPIAELFAKAKYPSDFWYTPKEADTDMFSPRFPNEFLVWNDETTRVALTNARQNAFKHYDVLGLACREWNQIDDTARILLQEILTENSDNPKLESLNESCGRTSCMAAEYFSVSEQVPCVPHRE